VRRVGDAASKACSEYEMQPDRHAEVAMLASIASASGRETIGAVDI
jgi:hypothetical protein